MIDSAQRRTAKIQRQDTRSFCVQGDMTFDTVTALWHQSVELFSIDSAFQIDLAAVTHTDSAGLALLVEWLREASRRGARLEFLNMPEQMVSLAGAANVEPLLIGQRNHAAS